jgi:hypothetical protein
MRQLVLAMSLLTLPVLMTADQHVDAPHAKARPTAPRISQERLDQIRRSLVAQIAVYDQAEAAPRAPSAQEAAALTRSAPEANVSVALPGGGQALLANGTQFSFAVATRSDDGTLRITHGISAEAPLTQTGGRHAR